jgi:hypothetical protein
MTALVREHSAELLERERLEQRQSDYQKVAVAEHRSESRPLLYPGIQVPGQQHGGETRCPSTGDDLVRQLKQARHFLLRQRAANRRIELYPEGAQHHTDEH